MATLEQERRAGLTYGEAPRMGWAEEDLAAYLRRKAVRREGVEAHETALEQLRERGLGGRLGVEEAGLGRRQEAGFEFARPLRTAQTGLFRAETREATARTGLAAESLDYARSIRGYRQEQERQKEKRSRKLTDIYEEEPGEGYWESYLEGLRTPGGGRKPLGGRLLEKYLLNY